jgi:hypothetical protein
MWFMVEYGLYVPITQNTRIWAKGLLQKESSDAIKREFGTKNPHISMTTAKLRKGSEEKQPENVGELC